MKIIPLILTLLIFSCGADWQTVNTPVVKKQFNGDVIDLAPNSYQFISHTDNHCGNSVTAMCRKVLNAFDLTPFDQNKIRAFTWEFILNDQPTVWPDFVIIWQLWFQFDAVNGNHPFLGMRLRNINNHPTLELYSNEWQWRSYNLPEDDPEDATHQHQQPTVNGSVILDVGKTYKIRLVINDVGRVIAYVNGIKMADELLNTMSYTQQNIVQYGAYWSKEWNSTRLSNDQLNMTFYNVGYNEMSY